MKKIISLLITLILLVQVVCVFADETATGQVIPERVEISFRVGDETLMINGNPVTVEKPYVVGVGVTLVPLRVITEAFGAKVEWIAETKSIVLTYPDVNILLQINNPIAEVNGKAQELLSAPELTPTGFTMVPLRFISETFGAQVSYDDATKSITVVKETAAGNGNMVSVGSDEKYIGDSLDGWVIENSSELSVADRAFDGSYTAFDYKGCDIEVYVEKKAADYDFDRDFNEYKKLYSTNMTLVKAEKNPELKTMHFQTRNNDVFIEDKMYVTDEYIYAVVVACEVRDTAVRNEALEMAATFSLTYPTEDVYDLSKARDGMRVYESETLKYSIEIPNGYTVTREEGIGNKVVFSNTEEGNIESVSVCVYSKQEFGSAEEACRINHKMGLEYFNSSLYSSNNIGKNTYSGYEAFEYRYDISTSSMTATGRDIYFELGDYIYSINVTVENNAEGEPLAEKILGSFKAELLDANEIGILMYEGDDYGEGTYECKGTLWSVNVPYSFSSSAESDNGVALIHRTTQVAVVIEVSTVPVTTATTVTLNDLSQSLQDSYSKQGYTLESSDSVMINGNRFSDMVYSIERDGLKYYARLLLYYKDGVICTATAAFPELYYSDKMIAEVDSIIQSIVIK